MTTRLWGKWRRWKAWTIQILFSIVLIVASMLAPTEALVSNKEFQVAQSVQDWIQTRQRQNKKSALPLTNTIFLLPPDCFSDQVSYLQKATNLRIKGYSNLQAACQNWEDCFQTDLGDVEMNLGRVSMVEIDTLLVQWNVTWVPPTAAWMVSLAEFNGWTPVYSTYVHLADQVSTFSYKAVATLFWDAFTTQKLRIPLACVQGTSMCRLSSPTGVDSDGNQQKGFVVSIQEDLGYAQDLRRGVLRNRKCAQDLRLFLETGRRIDSHSGLATGSTKSIEDWDETVATSLPWQTVPGMNPLDIDPNSNDEETDLLIPVFFLGSVALTLLGFATVMAPELIGQSLFGPPNYIVPPSELNSIY